MYKLLKDIDENIFGVSKTENTYCLSFHFDPANTDYANFKRHLQGFDPDGNSITPAELQDADGNTMSPEEVAEFLATLP